MGLIDLFSPNEYAESFECVLLRNHLSPKRRFYLDFFSLFVWQFSVIWKNEIKATKIIIFINMIIIMIMMIMMSTKIIILKLTNPPGKIRL